MNVYHWRCWPLWCLLGCCRMVIFLFLFDPLFLYQPILPWCLFLVESSFCFKPLFCCWDNALFLLNLISMMFCILSSLYLHYWIVYCICYLLLLFWLCHRQFLLLDPFLWWSVVLKFPAMLIILFSLQMCLCLLPSSFSSFSPHHVTLDLDIYFELSHVCSFIVFAFVLVLLLEDGGYFLLVGLLI